MSHLDLHYALGEAGFRWMDVSTSVIQGPPIPGVPEKVDRTLVFLDDGWGFSLVSYPDEFAGYGGMLVRPDGLLFGKEMTGPDDEQFLFPSEGQAVQSIQLIAKFIKEAS